MGNRPAFAPEEWYHCYNRGVDKRVIFETPRDYQRFLMLLYASNGTASVHISNIQQLRPHGPSFSEVIKQERGDRLVDIGGYALMPNHYHLLLRARIDGGITKFMRKVATGYAMYFNTQKARAGTLFTGKFKSRHVADDRYLRRIIQYIHANPAEIKEPGWKYGSIRDERGLKQFLAKYPYSSLPDYEGTVRGENVLVDISSLLEAMEERPTIATLLRDAQDFVKTESL